MKVESCQDFKEGCCGCCVNMRWSEKRLHSFLCENSAVVTSVIARQGKDLRLRDLVEIHLKRGGWHDYLLAFIMVPFTLGLSALFWKRRYGSCCFAGWLDKEEQRAGCLIHPERLGGADLRKHAFPLVPTLKCDRDMRCPLLEDAGEEHLNMEWFELSRVAAKSLNTQRHM